MLEMVAYITTIITAECKCLNFRGHFWYEKIVKLNSHLFCTTWSLDGQGKLTETSRSMNCSFGS